MKFISGLFSFILIVIAVAFAISNRQSATISLWPLDVKIEAPLYLLTLGTLLFGVLAGAAIAWFSFLPHRLRAGQLRRALVELQDKVATIQPTVTPPVLSQNQNGDLQLAETKPKWRLRSSRS